MSFHWSLSDNKPPQVSRTLLSILTYLNNAVIWMFLAYPPISNSSGPLAKPLGIVPSALITISATVTVMFHCFFSSLARSKYLSLFLFSFIFTLVCHDGKVYYSAGSLFFFFFFVFLFLFFCFCFLFFLTTPTFGLLAGISDLYLKISENFTHLILRMDSGLCIHHLVVWSNFNFFPVDHLPHSCLVLYSFCARLRHSLIMRLIISFLSPYNLHLLFCLVLFIFAFT